MKALSQVFALLVGSLFSSTLCAAPAPQEPFNQYYTLHMDASAVNSWSEPMQVLQLKIAAAVDLLWFDFHNEAFPPPAEKYDRNKHFGTWIDDPRDQNCYNTRAKVLMRDSKSPVGMSRSKCTVATGEWHEPYAGLTHTQATGIQIDHMVPLKNTYISGGSRWDWRARCLYANYMGNSFHLVSADGPQNMNKGDRTPADWMPPNRAITCDYLRNWLALKAIWGLVLHVREVQAIQKIAQQAGCARAGFMMPRQYLDQQRQFMMRNIDLCVGSNVGSGEEYEGEP